VTEFAQITRKIEAKSSSETSEQLRR